MPRRVVLAWYAAEDPAVYAPERFPVSIRNSDGTHISAVPSLDGRSVKIAVSASFSELPDADRLDRNVSPRLVDVIDDAVVRYMSGLVPGPVRVSAHMDGYTPDGHALVGPMPGAPNLWLLGGFSGHGFKHAPVIGQVVTDLVRDGRTDLPITHLDPARYLSAEPVSAPARGPCAGR
jgi:sarcosine oxidase